MYVYVYVYNSIVRMYVCMYECMYLSLEQDRAPAQIFSSLRQNSSDVRELLDERNHNAMTS